MSDVFDIIVVGAGIVGLSIARQVKIDFPELSVAVVEKEEDAGLHASGRGSGVLHAGFYYSPDTFKAKFSVEGSGFWRRWCEERGIPILKTGKVVVATSESEKRMIYELERRGKRNRVEVYVIGEKELAEIEPNAKTFEVALWSPNTAVVNPSDIVRSVVDDCVARGVRIFFSKKFVRALRSEKSALFSDGTKISYGLLINCAGAWADRIAHEFGVGHRYRVLPFKGTYFVLEKSIVRKNVYPVPDLRYPFLGVHLTPSLDGKTYVGPTVLPAMSREDYKVFFGKPSREVFGYIKLLFSLFVKDSRFRRFAFREVFKWSRRGTWLYASRMVKNLEPSDLKRSGKVGIRPQVVDVQNLKLVDDFVIERAENSIHIINAISPAFTSAPAIARWVVRNFL